MDKPNHFHARHSLNGAWSFRTDPLEKGLEEQWFCMGPDSFGAKIQVPGAIQSQDGAAYPGRCDARRTRTAHESFGGLDPDIPITRSEYRGVAWYMREFCAPDFGAGDRVWLCMDAVHPSAVAWIDGSKAGEHRTGPLEPCRLDITRLISPRGTHRLAVMVTEEGRLLQGVVKWPYFSGIYKDAYLEVTKGALISDVYVRTDIVAGVANVQVTLSGRAAGAGDGASAGGAAGAGNTAGASNAAGASGAGGAGHAVDADNTAGAADTADTGGMAGAGCAVSCEIFDSGGRLVANAKGLAHCAGSAAEADGAGATGCGGAAGAAGTDGAADCAGADDACGCGGADGTAECRMAIAVPDFRLWDPDSPCLYTCTVRLISGGDSGGALGGAGNSAAESGCGGGAPGGTAPGGGAANSDGVAIDERTLRFGFRSFSRQGKQLFLNGKPLFLRGTGFAGAAGFPNPEPGAGSAGWYRQIVARAKEYGFNYLRWHTYAMEPAMLDAADELGLLVQSELFSLFFETEEERAVTEEQCRLMLLRNRSRPSVACFVMGNEHDGTNPAFIGLRDSLCRMARRMAPGALVMDSDGIATAPSANAGHGFTDIVSAGLDIGIGGVLDMAPAIADMAAKNEKPYMIHEFGYPESFPQIADMPEYTGGTRPFWMEHARRSAKASGLEDLLPAFAENSRKLHFRIVKKAVEDARKADGLAGYGHWGLFDFVHESTGLMDIFLRDKGGSAAEFRKANGELALAMTPACDRFTCYQGESYGFDLFLSNHSGRPLYGQTVEWELAACGEAIDAGSARFSAGAFGVTALGRHSARGPAPGAPCAAVLKASVKGAGVSNEWNVWFFPKVENPSYGSRVCVFKDGWQTAGRLRSFCPDFAMIGEAALWEADAGAGALLVAPLITDAVADYLKRGGRVLLLPTYYVNGNPGLPMLPSSFGPMPSFAGSAGGCGTMIASHPALDGFPHEGWCDYQWFDLIGGQRVPRLTVPFHLTTPAVFDLGKWPAKIQPIIRSIPNWKQCDSRAYLFEAAVGAGRLLAASMRLFETVFTNPESAWLLDSMLKYATGDGFEPAASISGEQFDALRVPADLTSL
ncbi:MAG: hypothetical protein LBL83_05005 [Clostridiales bacterium]|jgi:hypothetical protein|nr:hypothetical protein [Clostridiales bacterium]